LRRKHRRCRTSLFYTVPNSRNSRTWHHLPRRNHRRRRSRTKDKSKPIARW
jgi:hypothetical protein